VRGWRRPGRAPSVWEGFLQECLGEVFGPGSQRVHAAQARGSLRDVHGRGAPSEDFLFGGGSR
jgi:hypothetical protein